MKFHALIVLIAFFLYAGAAVAEDKDIGAAKEFFQHYVALSDAFDPDVVELYADSASIRTLRTYPFGRRKVMEMRGRKWKKMVKAVMPLAKAKNDRNTYSDIEVTREEGLLKIKANRYTLLKCYTDTGYYMKLEPQEDGTFIIIEEYMETQPRSNC